MKTKTIKKEIKETNKKEIKEKKVNMTNEKSICKKGLSLQDCELAILRQAVDLAETKMGQRVVNTPEVQDMISTVEDFLKRKNLICYGGVAIDALLPEQDKIYNKDVELSDYDFFSANALDDAKELANIYFKKGYSEVEAKSGAHHGTYKVFVNFLGVADITSIPKDLFDTLKKEAVRVGGILYVPPNYLRMSMYLELSRPAGDISRWEKVWKRLSLINKYYPLTDKQCSKIDFQRKIGDDTNEEKQIQIYETVKNAFIHQGCVFFGGYAISQYSQYMPKNLQKSLQKIPDFDVLSNDPETTSEIVKERSKDIGESNVKIIIHEPFGEIIPIHYEIKVNDDTVAFIYKPIGCHSYNIIEKDKEHIKIATIDTMLSFYLAFLYVNKGYYDPDRIICMSKFLFDVQEKNRLEQKGLLKRFSINCYGHQESVEEMRADKAKKFKDLSGKRGTREYDEWFLSYKPGQKDNEIKKQHYNSRSDNRPASKTIRPIRPNRPNATRKNKKRTNKDWGLFYKKSRRRF